MKSAIIHEWLVNYAGSEKVVESFTNIWPDAPVFTLVDFLDEKDRMKILKGKRAHTSVIQKLPFASKHHRNYLPFFPLAIEQFDLTGYDLIISSSHAVAKGVLTDPYQLHICYCHTPMRYAWDLYHSYLTESNLKKGLKGALVKWTLHKLRMWDYISASRVDYFIANSSHIARRIKKIYNREAAVIYPPVDVHLFETGLKKDNYYLTASRMVPYKRMDIIVEAFASMPDKKLVVIGDGTEMAKIKSRAASNIEIIGYQDTPVLKEYMKNAKAFVFAAEEDFGIVVIEAMASGTPVIAFNRGGASETVIKNESGILFNEQTPNSIKEAVIEFEKLEGTFDHQSIRDYSLKFGRDIFEEKIKNFTEKKSMEFFNHKS